jgi:hypothetical protein
LFQEGKLAYLDGEHLRVVDVTPRVTDLKGGRGARGQVSDPGVAITGLGAQLNEGRGTDLATRDSLDVMQAMRRRMDVRKISST